MSGALKGAQKLMVKYCDESLVDNRKRIRNDENKIVKNFKRCKITSVKKVDYGNEKSVLDPELLVLEDPRKKRNQKPIPSKVRQEKEEIFKMNSYTTIRKKREEFRKNLVKMIMDQELEDNPMSDVNEDKIIHAEARDDLLKYYYYLMLGIDDVYVAPMDHNLLDRILSLIPIKWRIRFKNTLSRNINDAKEDYAVNLKKSIVDFVLQDPLEDQFKFQDKQETMTKERYEVKNFPKEISLKYKRTRAKLEKNLYLYHPCIKKTLELWHQEFRTLRLIDKKELLMSDEAFDLSMFESTFNLMVKRTISTLCKIWLPKIANILTVAKRKGELPPDTDEQRISKFFNCLGIVMESQLGNLCVNSMEDYMNFLVELAPMILDEILDSYKKQIIELIQEHRIGPELQIQHFDKYITLINETDDDSVKKYLNSEQSMILEEYSEFIEKYDKLAKNIPIEFDRTFFSGIFDVHRGDLMEYMSRTACILKNKLVDRVVEDYQSKSRIIGEDYEKIAETVLSVPINTKELMVLRAFVTKAENEMLLDLQNRLREIIEYVLFLSDYTYLTPVELKTNNFAFQS